MNGENDWRPVLRALIEALLAFDHPAFPALSVAEVEARLFECFPIAGERGAALQAELAALDPAFVGVPLADRRTTLQRWARSDAPAQRRLYASVKRLVMVAAYSMPQLRRAVGYEGEG